MVTGRGGGAAVDTTDVALRLDNNGHMHPGARGVTLRELVRRDVRKLMNDLVSVDIRWMKIGDAMAKELADLLRKCPRVTSLDVQDNFISCIGCMEIAKACASHAHIATLNLSGNRIADLGAAVVSSMLMANSSLTHLDLCGNRLERQATEGIGGGLRGNTTLQALLLDENFFGDEGANELGWALTYNSTLRTLSLRGNEITSAGASMLSAGIAKNQGLVKLDLSDNAIQSRGAIKLMDSLFHNTSIAELDLRNNQEFNEDAQDAILDAIDFAPQWVPISVEKRLAIAMALHPALAPDSQLFQIASIPVNALKAAYLTQAAGGKKVTANDKKTLVARCGLPADGKVREAVAPQLSHYETEPLTAESPLRIAISHAINTRRRTIHCDYEGRDGQSIPQEEELL